MDKINQVQLDMFEGLIEEETEESPFAFDDEGVIYEENESNQKS